MKVAYAGVSTEDQNLERQIETSKSFGAEKIFTEKKPGAAVGNRRQFQMSKNLYNDKKRINANPLVRRGLVFLISF